MFSMPNVWRRWVDTSGKAHLSSFIYSLVHYYVPVPGSSLKYGHKAEIPTIKWKNWSMSISYMTPQKNFHVCIFPNLLVMLFGYLLVITEKSWKLRFTNSSLDTATKCLSTEKELLKKVLALPRITRVNAQYIENNY